MIINNEKEEVYIPSLSIEKLAKIIEEIRSQPRFHDYKIVIDDGLNEDTIIAGDIFISN